MVRCPPLGPDEPISIVGLDSSIQNPRVWGLDHVGGFNDPMVDCGTKSRYRADHLHCLGLEDDANGQLYAYLEHDDDSLASARKKLRSTSNANSATTNSDRRLTTLSADQLAATVGPDTKVVGSRPSRQFNLMFERS